MIGSDDFGLEADEEGDAVLVRLLESRGLVYVGVKGACELLGGIACLVEVNNGSGLV